MSSFEIITCENLNVVCGGQNPRPQNPPQRVDGRDVREVAQAAITSTLAPATMLPNIPDAIGRVFRTDRVGTNIGDRLLDGFTGLFGIDPLRPRN